MFDTEYKPGIYRVKVGYKHLVIAEHIDDGHIRCFAIPKFTSQHKEFPLQIRVVDHDELMNCTKINLDGEEF